MKFSRKPQDPGAARHGAKLRLIDGAKPDKQHAVDRHGDGDGGGGGDHIAVKHRISCLYRRYRRMELAFNMHMNTENRMFAISTL